MRAQPGAWPAVAAGRGLRAGACGPGPAGRGSGRGGKATFTYGAFLTAALSFLIAALVVYYIMVMPVARLLQLLERNKAAACRDCPECTMSIPIAARRCPECTAEIVAGTEQPQLVG